MHTYPELDRCQRAIYHRHLESDHDYRVYAEILDMDENFITQVPLLDGQVNISKNQEGPERTASVTLSDPERALTFGAALEDDPTGTLWVNRLVRLVHEVDVPGLGDRESTGRVQNLYPNPSFETGLTGWASSPSQGWTVTRVLDGTSPVPGDYVARAVFAGTPGGGAIMSQSPAANRVTIDRSLSYTYGCWVKRVAANAPSQVRLLVPQYNASNGFISSVPAKSNIDLPVGQWTWIEGTIPASSWAATTATVTFAVYAQSAAQMTATGTLLFDGFMLVEGLTMLPYFDGSKPDLPLRTYDWMGAAHASTSIQTDWSPRFMTVRAIPLVGVPTSVQRKGGEISLELADKSVLMDRGVKPRTYKKGMRVDLALRSLARDLTGERNLRIPTTKKRLSKPYTVGMGENDLTPWRLFKRIAGTEMGWRVYYSSDGFLTAEPTSTTRGRVDVECILSLPDSSTPLNEFSNYVKITSNRKQKNVVKGSKKKKKKTKTVDVTYDGVAWLFDHPLSPVALSRNGVPRLMPLVENNNSLKTASAVTDRAVTRLKTEANLERSDSYEVIPFFHLDSPDALRLPEGVGDVLLNEVSLPLGTGGNMSLNKLKWVSRPVKSRNVRSRATTIKRKKKGGKSNA